MTNVRPGFYPDGTGVDRWWDGDAWTDDTREAMPVHAPAYPPPYQDGVSRPKASSGLPVWVLVVGGLIILSLALRAFGLGDGSDDPVEKPSASGARDVGNEGSARIMCEKFVKERLKSPASADFSDTKSSGNGPDYSVSGVVDSDNALGASIRNDYRCLIRYDGENKWKLVELNGLDQ